MSRMVGADLAEVRELAAAFERAAQQLNQTSARLRNGIQISAWVGPFAVRFRHLWDSDHSVRLRLAADALTAQARQLRQEADQQDAASSAHTGGGSRTGRVSHRDLVDFAESGAGDRAAVTRAGYHALTDADLRKIGVDPAMLHDPETGMDAKVYRDASGRIVVAFGGTQVTQAGDLKSDAEGAIHLMMSRQAEQSVNLALALKNHVGAENLVLTGHSLGGRNAALASIATGARAVTFNAAGVSAGDHMFARTAGGAEVGYGEFVWGSMGGHLAAPNVDNYSTSTDPLTNVQGLTTLPDAVGRQHQVASDKQGLNSHSDFDGFRAGVPND